MGTPLRRYALAGIIASLEVGVVALKGFLKFRLRMVMANKIGQLKPVLTPGLACTAARVQARMLPPLAVPGGKATMPPPGRSRGRRIIVYHEASNDHVEMYIYDERTGIAHNVGVHVLSADEASKIRFNSEGWLTEDSKKSVLAIFNGKAHNREFVGISTDHRLDEARQSHNEWTGNPGDYGAGPHREVISDIEVEFTSSGSTVEWWDWELNPYAPMYCHVVFPSTPERRGTVGVIGYKSLPEPVLEDRLHLAYDGTDIDRFRRNLGDGGRASLKMDGSGSYFVTDKYGTRIYSPRFSKKTGRRIEYTGKMGALQDVTSEEKIVGMGELVFVDTETGRILRQSEIGGILNAHALPDRRYEPRLYVYRIDSVGRRRVIEEPYWEHNRPRCEELAARHPQLLVPDEVGLDDLEATKGEEGVVGVPAGHSVLNGRKLKWEGDTVDVTVTKVEFSEGPRGGIEGVVWYHDPRSGRQFKTASGFTHDEKRAMMAEPQAYEGRVMKISELGTSHHNRAAKFEGWHDSKGVF